MPATNLLRKRVTQTGTIQTLAGSNIPEGYLVCDGSIVNIADYPKLYATIGTAHGHGNNDGLTFHLPDLRGRFMRGKDAGAGRDTDAGVRTLPNAGGNTGDNVGSVQDNNVRAHTHNYNGNYAGDGSVGGGNGLPMYDPSNVFGNITRLVANVTNGAGSDTRPVNVNLKYIIKAI